MKEYILENLKEYYKDNFLQADKPVYLLHDLIGKKKVVELDTKNLGSAKEEIDSALEEIFNAYPSDKFYSIFYYITEYKSEKAKKEFLQKYYKENSRIPEIPISIQDMNYTDAFGIRIAFADKEQYENLPTYFTITDFYNYSEKIVFFKYYDDYLYQKERESAQKWFEQNNRYLLKPLNKEEFLIERYGFIKDLGKNIEKLKEDTQEKYGDLFISWNEENSIFLMIRNHEATSYLVIQDLQKCLPPDVRPDYESLGKLIVDKKFKTEKEVAQFIKDNLVSKKCVIFPQEATEKLYEEYKIIDMHEWLRLSSLSDQKMYDIKDWSEVKSAINDILKYN